ncbi:MAG: twin-arginine translocase TatA/TatE family subunit [Kiritimatiellae bacterium]|nr:twin-arginine translocase TatA/TatE family subunit [Kiritimatiellia bacterium]
MSWANIGPFQLLIVLAIILLLFGGKKLPDLAHALGKSLGEFKKGRDEGEKLAANATKDLIEEVKADPTKVVEAKVESKDASSK